MWSPYTQANINKVEKVQRRAARWVSNDYSSYSSVTQILNTLGWRSLEQRRADARLILLYKIVYGLVEIPIPAGSGTARAKTISYRIFSSGTSRPNFSSGSFRTTFRVTSSHFLNWVLDPKRDFKIVMIVCDFSGFIQKVYTVKILQSSLGILTDWNSLWSHHQFWWWPIVHSLTERPDPRY